MGNMIICAFLLRTPALLEMRIDDVISIYTHSEVSVKITQVSNTKMYAKQFGYL